MPNLKDIIPESLGTPPNYEAMVRSIAQEEGVDPEHLSRMARQESGFNPSARSPKGAIGIMQLMPNTAKDLGVDPEDPEQNIRGGARYFKQLSNRFGGDVAKATAAYNTGPERVAAGGPLPAETQDYVNRIMGDPGQRLAAMGVPEPAGGANVSNIEPEQIPYQQLPQQDETPMGKLFGALKSLAGGAAEHSPELAGMAAMPLAGIPAIGPAAAPIIGGLGAAAMEAGIRQPYQHLFHPDEAPSDTADAARRIRNSFFGNLAGNVQIAAMEKYAPVLARSVYRKLGGIGAGDAANIQAVADMVERHIPAGMGRMRKITNLKAAENAGLDAIYDKYPMTPGVPKQVPGIVTPGRGLQSVQFATPTQNAASKMGIIRDLVNHYGNDSTIPKAEVEAAGKAVENFLGRQGEDISFTDARRIKQNIAKKVPYGSETEGMQQARKTLGHYVTENIAKKIPDAADREKFLAHNAELEKLINIEDLKGFDRLHKQILGYHVAKPLAGAAIGGVGGYFTHMNPWAAAATGAAAGMMGSPTTASVGVNLLRNPWAQAIMSMPTREAFQSKPQTAIRIGQTAKDYYDQQ